MNLPIATGKKSILIFGLFFLFITFDLFLEGFSSGYAYYFGEPVSVEVINVRSIKDSHERDVYFPTYTYNLNNVFYEYTPKQGTYSLRTINEELRGYVFNDDIYFYDYQFKKHTLPSFITTILIFLFLVYLFYRVR